MEQEKLRDYETAKEDFEREVRFEDLDKYQDLDDLIKSGMSDISGFFEKTDEIAPTGEQVYETKSKSDFRNFKDTTKNLVFNRNVEIDNLAKESGNKEIKFKGDMLNSVAGEIDGELYTAQTDNEGNEIGKSLTKIFEPARKANLESEFDDYLINYSNIDRHLQGKGNALATLQESTDIVNKYEKLHPEFKVWAEDVWQYGRNAIDNMLDAGLINSEFAEKLKTMYPHYVPYVETMERKDNFYPDLKEVKAKGLKRAKGKATDIDSPLKGFEKYTYAYKKAIRENQLYQEIVNTLGQEIPIGIDDRTEPTDLTNSLYRDENGNFLTAYVNGEQKTVRITDDLYKSLKRESETRIKELENKLSFVTKPIQKLSNVRRNILTSWNPSFLINNPIKDIQEGIFNSKHPVKFLKNYFTSLKELWSAKTPLAKRFLTLYGDANLQGNYELESGTNKGLRGAKKGLRGLSKFNNLIELAPRFAEFKASMQSGESIYEAMYNAREVTTNFNRGGTITKALNRNGFTFLNASVQGFSKFVRNLTGENGARGVAGSLLKATIFGIAPAVFNELIFGTGDDKDEDYKALPDYVKDNYYLIKTEDGNFIRIPKGRVLSVFGSAARRTIETLEGEENAFKGYLTNAISQVGMNDPSENNLFTPLMQAKNNEAWYGGSIIPSRLENTAPNEQYDASIDKFSIWLANTPVGKKMGLSPYKINYVLDQYSGGIGDVVLPMITDETTNGADSFMDYLIAPIKDKFQVNSTDDNKYASDFYSLKDKIAVKTSDIKETDEYKVQSKYIDDISSDMAKLYKEKREVQANTSLSKEEKYKKVQNIQKEINNLAKAGLDNYNKGNINSSYSQVGDRQYNKYTDDNGNLKWRSTSKKDTSIIDTNGLTTSEKITILIVKEK